MWKPEEHIKIANLRYRRLRKLPQSLCAIINSPRLSILFFSVFLCFYLPLVFSRGSLLPTPSHRLRAPCGSNLHRAHHSRCPDLDPARCTNPTPFSRSSIPRHCLQIHFSSNQIHLCSARLVPCASPMAHLTTPAVIIIVLVACLAVTTVGAALYRKYNPADAESRFTPAYDQGQYMRTVRMRNYSYLKRESLGKDLESRCTSLNLITSL